MRFSIPYQVAILATITVAVLARGRFDHSWNTIDGGGVMRSTSTDGVFELSGTIGQPDAGVLNGGDFELTGAFWFKTPHGDCNQDGVTSLPDVVAFEDCMTGPGGSATEDPCQCFDLDRSGLVDLIDFGILQSAFLSD
jgi:hypothetical protein